MCAGVCVAEVMPFIALLHRRPWNNISRATMLDISELSHAILDLMRRHSVSWQVAALPFRLLRMVFNAPAVRLRHCKTPPASVAAESVNDAVTRSSMLSNPDAAVHAFRR